MRLSFSLTFWLFLKGEGKILDTKKYFIICANNLGSCYGATNARSINPKTKSSYGKDFPLITTRDMALAHEKLRKELNINSIHLLIGGSMGGQVALEWTVEHSNIIRNLCVLATNARHSSWGIAFNEAQRMAIETDLSLYDDNENAGSKGLETARAIAMLSYRNHLTYNQTQIDISLDGMEDFRTGLSLEEIQENTLVKYPVGSANLERWALGWASAELEAMNKKNAEALADL